MRWGAFADISGSTITGNLECAVSPRDGAKVLLTNNPLITTAQPSTSICSTIGAYRNTTVRLAGGNTITNTGGGSAIDIIQGSALRAQSGVDTISGRINIGRLTNADFRNANITGDMTVRLGSWLRLRAPSSVTGNINITPDSMAQFQSGPTISGTVTCFGSGTVGLSPTVGLTLVDSMGGNVVTSEGGVAWAFRANASGNPNFLSGGFSGCN